ncbi:hypothetical protein QF004_000103 [Chryseobacterium sp. MDT2-18]|uniref:Uncharacterized protein n=1 Tax=Chryseobacterium salivictor TaxID=2547600 RepID=A0A4P6ZHB3_9FLAO|nr:hypothetical protein [Chryseobacterium sp. MDT2-18]QBO59029.1 hypothetical protein NBC122_02223 [Chryseobacterium salivictor]
MKLKITLKQIILANLLLFVISFAFLKLSDSFRLTIHWIYSLANLWWLFFAFPCTMILSINNVINSVLKRNKNLKYSFFSLLPILLFTSIHIYNLWKTN